MITRKIIFLFALLLSFSYQTNPEITLSQKQAYVSSIDFSITFDVTLEEPTNVYVFLNCPSQISFEPVSINNTDKVAKVSKELAENEVNSLMGQLNQIDCVLGINYKGESFTYKDKTVTLVKKVKTDGVTFKYMDENKKITYTKIQIIPSIPSNKYFYQTQKWVINEVSNDSIDLGTSKTSIYIIVFNENKEIVYITDQLEIIDEGDISYGYLRSYYLPENFPQKITAYLSGSKSEIMRSISDVYYQKDSDKISLSQVLPALSERSSEYSTEITLTNSMEGEYKLHVVLLGYDVEISTELTKQISIVPSIASLITVDSIRIDSCSYYKKNYNLSPTLIKEDLDLKIDYVQGNTVLHFKDISKTFILSSSDLNDVGTGLTEIKLYDHNDFDIPLYTYPFTATNIVLDSSSKIPSVTDIITFSGLSCDATSIPLSVDDTPLTCENYTNPKMTCRIPETVLGGEHTIKVDSGIELDKVNIYTRGDGAEIDITIPTDVKVGENTVTIRSKSENSKVSDVKVIKVKRNNAQILDEYNAPASPTSSALKYFNFINDNTEIELVLNLEQDMKYSISQIIFANNTIVDYTDEQYVIVHYFSISSKYFFYSSSSKSVSLKFNSLSQAKNYIQSIYYKIDEGSISTSSCVLQEADLTLVCQFTTQSDSSKQAYFGISEKLLSSQTIFFLTSSVTGADGCYSYVKESTETPITVTITSQQKLNNIKANIDQSNSNPISPEVSDTSYVFKVNIKGLSEGEHKIYIRVDDGINIEVPSSTFSIQKLIEISSVSPDILYLTSEPQTMTIGFSNVITNEQIKNIILKDSSSNTITLTPNSFEGVYNSITMNVNFQSPYISGTYSISYVSQCGQEVDTGKTIVIKYNEIEKVEPFSLQLSELDNKDATFTVTYKYTPYVQISHIKISGNEYEISQGQGKTYTFTIMKGALIEESLENITTKYDSSDDKVEISTKTILFYKNPIELVREKQIILLNKTVDKISILLKYQIIKEQIFKIDFQYVNGTTVELDSFTLSNSKTQIDISKSITFDSLGDYYVNIYDKKDESTKYKYTITAGDNFDLLNANFNITITLPAIQGENYIYIKSGSYELSQIKMIKFKKINKSTLEEGNLIFCTSGYTDENCSNDFLIDYSNLDGENAIKLTITYEISDKYTMKYILSEISESNEKTLSFEDTDYILEDYTFNSELIYVPSTGLRQVSDITINLFSNSAATSINQSISCSISSNPIISCNSQCIVQEEEVKNLNGNDVMCSMLKCTFTLGTTIKETPYDINIRFTSQDQTDKKLRLLVVNYNKDNICQLKGFTENVTLTVLYQNDMADVKYYVESKEISSVVKTQIEDGTLSYYQSVVTIPATIIDSITDESLYLRVVRDSSELTVKDIPIKIVDYGLRSYNGNLTAQLKNTQYVEYLFTSNINKENIISFTLNNSDNTESITPTNCEDSTNEKGLTCEYDLSNHVSFGEYTVIYQTSQCDRLFIGGITVTISAPPRILNSVSPTYMKQNTAETFYLTYLYKLYEKDHPLKIKLMVDKYTPGDGVNEYEIKEYVDNRMSFEILADDEIQLGYYFIKVVYDLNDDSKNEYYSNINILVYQSEISFDKKQITKWTGENIKDITNEFTTAILIEQVKSISIRKNDETETVMTKDVDYSLSTTKLVIIKDLVLNEVCNYTISLTDLTGIVASFTIVVTDNVSLREANISYTFPKPASENESNVISISSDNYNLQQITKLVMKKSDNIEFTVYQRDCTVEPLTNTLTFNVTLEQWDKIDLVSIHDATGNLTDFKEQYVTLRGYYPLRDFYFYDQPKIEVSFDFYSQQIAKEVVSQIYFDTLVQQCSYNESIVKCTYTIPESSPKEPKDISVTVGENGKAKKTIQFLTYTSNNVCQLNQSPPSNVEFTINAASCQGDFNAILNGQNETSSCDETSHTYTYTFSSPTTTPSKIYIERINRPLDVIDVEVPDIIVSLIKDLEISKVINSNLPYSETVEVEVKFNQDYYNRTDIQSLKLTNTEDTTKIIVSTQCGLSLEDESWFKYSCNFTLTSDDKGSKYYITFINKCGIESATKEDLTISFINAPNVVTLVNPKSVKLPINNSRRNLRNLQATSPKLSLYFINALNEQNRPYSITLINRNNNVLTNKITLDESSISGNSMSISVDTSNIDPDLYYLQMNFANNISYKSDKYILFYYYELELAEESKEVEINTKLPSLNIKFKNPIIDVQIKKIGIRKKSDTSSTAETTLTRYAVFTNEPSKINIEFEGDGLLIEDNYIITIYDNGDDEHILYFSLNYFGNIEFQVEKDIFFVDTESGSIDINVTFTSNGVAESNKGNISINGTQRECSHEDGNAFIICSYPYEALFKGTQFILQLGDNAIDLLKKEIYLVKYSFKNYPLLSEYYNYNFLSVISTLSFDFYLDDFLLTASSSEKDGMHTYVIPYYMLVDVISDEGNYVLYAMPPNREKLPMGPNYIFVTDKKIELLGNLYAKYIGTQKFNATFNHSLIENEIESFTLYNDTNSFTSTGCKRNETNDTIVICDFNLETANIGTYFLNYTNILGTTTTHSSTVTLGETFALVTISPDLIAINDNTTEIVLSYNRDISGTSPVLFLVDKETKNETSIEEAFTVNYNTITFVFNHTYSEGKYLIKTSLNNNIFTSSEDTYIILYDKDSGVFDFNRLYIISDNEPFTLTITPSLNTITNIYLVGSDTPLDKENNSYYVYTVPPNSENANLTFEYQSTTAGSEKILIQKTVYVVKASTDLFDVSTSLNECTFYGDKLSVTLSPKEGISLESSRLELFLFKIKNGLKDKVFEFSRATTGYVYTLLKSDYDELLSGSYILYITERNDTDKFLYMKEDISFTAITPPEYIFYTDTAITFSNVACELNLAGSLLTLLKGELIKTVPIESSSYDSSTREIKCNITPDIISKFEEFTFYQLFSNGNFLLGNLFISKTLSDANFEITTIGNNVRLSGNYYVPLIKNLMVNEGENTITYISSTLTTSSSDNIFYYNNTNNVISFVLELDNHSYYLKSIASTSDDVRTLNLPISESVTDAIFTLEKDQFFIDITEEKPSINVTVVAVSDPLFNSETFVNSIYIDGVKGELIEQEELTYVFKYEATTPRNVSVTYQGNGTIYKTTIAISTYSYMGKTCQIVNDITNTDFIISVVSPDSVKEFTEMTLGDVRVSPSITSTVSYKTTREFIFSKSDLASVGTKQLSAVINGKTVPVDNISVSTNSAISIASIEGDLVHGQPNQTMTIKVNESINAEDTILFHMRNVDNPTMEISTLCTIPDDKTISCVFDLTSIVNGEYTLLYKSQCDTLIEYTDSTITIIQHNTNTIDGDNNSTVIIPDTNRLRMLAGKEYTIKYSQDFTDDEKSKPIKINLQDINDPNISYNTTPLIYSTNSLTISLDGIKEGVYRLRSIYMINGSEYISETDKFIVVVQRYPPELESNETTIEKMTTIETLPIALKNPTFSGRFKSIKCTSDEFSKDKELEYSVNEKIINVNTSGIKFSSNNDYVFTLEDYDSNSKPLIFTVKISSQSTINVNHYIFVVSSSSSKTLSITVSDDIASVSLYINTTNTSPIPLSKSSSNVYTYSITAMTNDYTLIISFKKNMDSTTFIYSNKIIVTNNFENVVKHNILTCAYSKAEMSITLSSVSEQIDQSDFSMTLTQGAYSFNFKKIDTTYSLSQTNLNGRYTLNIYDNKSDSQLLFTTSIIFTDISMKTNTIFITDNTGSFSLESSCDLGNTISFTNTIVTIQSQSYNTSTKTNTYNVFIYNVGLIQSWGLFPLKYNNILSLSIGPYIYRSLSKATLIIEKPPIALGPNTISISSKEYSVENITKITLLDNTAKSFTYCSSNCNSSFSVANSILSFTVTLAGTGYYYIHSVEGMGDSPSNVHTYSSNEHVIKVDNQYAITIAQEYLYVKPTEYISLNIVFNNETVYQSITITSLLTNSNEPIEFDFDDSNPNCKAKECVIKSRKIASALAFPSDKTALKFTFIENDESKYILTNSIRLISAQTLPNTVEAYQIYYNNTHTFLNLLLDKTIYDEYKPNIKVETSNSKNCAVESNLNKNLTVSCQGQILTDFILKIIFFDEVSITKDISFTCQNNTVPIIEDGRYKCVTCREENPSTPYYYQEQCIASCPATTFEYYYVCYDSCEIINKPYIEDTKCVDSCSPGKGVMSSNNCVDCKEHNMVSYSNRCVSSCGDGLTLDSQTNTCVPISSSQCTPSSCKYGICNDSSGTVQCECPSDYYGIICSHPGPILANEVNSVLNNILPEGQVKPDFTNETVIFNLRDLNVVIDQKPTIVSDASVNQTKLRSIVSESFMDNLMSNSQGNTEKETFGLLQFLGIAFAVKLGNSNSGRRLDATLDTELAKIIDTGYKYYQNLANYNYTKGIRDVRNDTVPREYIYFFTYMNDNASQNTFTKLAKESKIAYVNYTNCLNGTNGDIKYFVGRELNNAIISGIPTESDSVTVTPWNSTSAVTLNECSSVKVSIPVVSEVNTDLYSYYKENGIDFYDYNDPAFTDRCWSSSEFDFDLPVKYRKLIVYQNHSFINDDMNCTYEGIDNETNTVQFTCPLGEYKYTFTQKELENLEMYKTKKLTMKCVGHVNVGKNFTFYLSLFVLIFLAVGEVLLFLFYENTYNPYISDASRIEAPVKTKNANIQATEERALANEHRRANKIKMAFSGDDVKKQHERKIQGLRKTTKENTKPTDAGDIETEVKVETNHNPQINEVRTESSLTSGSGEINPNQVHISVVSLSFVELLLKNFKELNPFAFTYTSMLKPTLMYLIALFVTDLFVLFGFNAVYFSDSMLEDRIYDSYRDNFGYPMRSEFDKITCSILSTFLITAILKGIIFVSYSEKDSFGMREFATIFNIVRYCLGGVLMLFLLLFFSIYSTTFCGLFLHAKYGWLYSGIWSLFMNWVILYPVGIVLMTVVEKTVTCLYKEEMVYYLKYFIF